MKSGSSFSAPTSTASSGRLTRSADRSSKKPSRSWPKDWRWRSICATRMPMRPAPMMTAGTARVGQRGQVALDGRCRWPRSAHCTSGVAMAQADQHVRVERRQAVGGVAQQGEHAQHPGPRQDDVDAHADAHAAEAIHAREHQHQEQDRERHRDAVHAVAVDLVEHAQHPRGHQRLEQGRDRAPDRRRGAEELLADAALFEHVRLCRARRSATSGGCGARRGALADGHARFAPFQLVRP